MWISERTCTRQQWSRCYPRLIRKILEKIKGWKQKIPVDFVFFRPCSLSPTEAVSDNTSDTGGNAEAYATQNLLFAYQRAWQRYLMSRYGKDIMLLDAKYKTMWYELPLLFLVVKTNVNYTVVGAFITQNETNAAIEEALKIFRAWNPKWKPSTFVLVSNSWQVKHFFAVSQQNADWKWEALPKSFRKKSTSLFRWWWWCV